MNKQQQIRRLRMDLAMRILKNYEECGGSDNEDIEDLLWEFLANKFGNDYHTRELLENLFCYERCEELYEQGREYDLDDVKREAKEKARETAEMLE